ncbi:glutathione S-transferase [Irpex rosettiformis]|uniref:Glutathione S-transferase n=1 Tax=Irpex rosettiformis TaxID=378272 RepID=A0ACB8U666_9APHY|nr:glutathione S-transferase [Irpex rosettiformis]
MTDNTAPKKSIHEFADKDGQFRRQVSSFRSRVSADPNAEFPAEADRYVLYITLGCPWAHRANLVRSLKGLEDIIQLVVMDYTLTEEGWVYTGVDGTAPCDPLYGFTRHKDLYLKADPSFVGRYTVPVLWDKKRETIVNNESSEIIRMFFTAFDHLLPPERRESAHGFGGYYPEGPLRGQIDELNDWVYNTVNNGVYKTGFASTQEAYENHLYPLFASLDRLEALLKDSAEGGKGPFLFGNHITEADIRLYTTIARFDVGYFTLFKCNLKMIRYEYPHLDKWYRRLYWDDTALTRGAFKKTTNFDHIIKGYAAALKHKTYPRGPIPYILPAPVEEEY